jgi:hypothetical protein
MRHAVSLASTFKYLVQLLVPNLDRATLAALILKEAKEGSSQNSEHDNVAYPLISIGVVLTFSPQLTNKERDNAASEINKTLEEVDEELDDFCRKFCGKRGRVLDQVAGGGEEGPDELDERGSQVGQGANNRGHGDFVWAVERGTV